MSEKSLFEQGLDVVHTSLQQAGWGIQPIRRMTNGYHLVMDKVVPIRFDKLVVHLGIILSRVSGVYVISDCSLTVTSDSSQNPTRVVLSSSEFFSYHGKYTGGHNGLLTGPLENYWVMKDAADFGAFFERYDDLAHKLGRHQLFRPRGRTN